MKIKTDYVPEDCDYLTAGKEYEARTVGQKWITDDEGASFPVNMSGLDVLVTGISWQIVEEKPFDIREHEFSDKRLSHDGDSFVFRTDEWSDHNDDNIIVDVEFNKIDAIAIAKALGVTGGDL